MTAATKASLSSLAHRIETLDAEPAALDERIDALLVATVPELLDLFGVGPDTAAALVLAAGDNPQRLHSEAAWAHLCGVAPVPDRSGRTNGRVTSDDGGDRQANSALWRIVIVRIAHDPKTRACFDRRVKGGRRPQSDPSGISIMSGRGDPRSEPTLMSVIRVPLHSVTPRQKRPATTVRSWPQTVITHWSGSAT